MLDAMRSLFSISEEGAGSPPAGVLATDPEIFLTSAPGGNENGPPTYATFTVTLSAASSETVTVWFRYLFAGTSTGDDQGTPFSVPSANPITFAPGETSKTFQIAYVSDSFDERDEHFVAELYNPDGGHFAAFHPVLRASAVIRDEDGPGANLAFFVSDPVLIEGDAGQHLAQFEIRLSRPAGPAGLVFNYTTRDGSAAAGSDYVSAAGTVTFSNGQEIAYVNVAIKGDTAGEHSESFFLDVTPPPIDIGTDGGVGEAQILDDDSAAGPVISLLRAVSNVEDPGNGSVNAPNGFAYHIVLSEPSATPVTVSYRLLLAGTGMNDDLKGFGSDGKATSPNNNKTVTFAPGETSKTVHIPTTQADSNDDLDEHFVLELYNPTGASFAGGVPTLAASGVVLDNDGPGSNLAFFVSDPVVSEGDAGTTTALFEIRLSRPAPTDLVFDWTVAPGTATASSDYVGVNNSVTIVQGQDVAFVRVTVKGDTLQEGAETFRLIVTPPAGSGLSTIDAVGEATILADDFALPAITLLRAEPSAELVGSLRWIVTLSEPSATPVTVSYRTMLGTADEDDIGGGSTGPANNGTLTFAPGETSQSIIVNLAAAGLEERDEHLVMELFSPSGAVFENGGPLLRASGVILDGETAVANPAIFVSDPVILEGDAGTKYAVFEVRLSQPPAAETVFSYTTADGTALAGSDYITRSGNLVFAPGQDVATVTVQITGDTASEISESFSLIVTPPAPGVYALAGATGEATLIDDDSTPPTITISPVVAAQEDFVLHRFTVTLSKPAVTDVTVQWAATPGTATTSSDLTSTLSGTLTILAGQNSGQILITPDPDGLVEFDETYFITLTNPTGAVFAGGTATQVATGIVLDNDGTDPKFALFGNNVTVKEGLGAFTPIEVVVRLTHPSETTLTFDVTAVNGTALAGSDFDLADTTLAFAPGQTTATVTVNIRADILGEATEAFTLSFAPSGSTDVDAPSPTITVTIQDGPGTPGADNITGTAQADGINGLAGNDTITGAAGDDTLEGGAGADSLTGGGGSDTYYIDVSADRTVETAAGPGGGIDTVISPITRTLGDNLENLILTGALNRSGTGNALANTITGNSGLNVLKGGDGNDTLSGGGGDDELRGEGGNDSMAGGLGNDRFFVDSTGDVTTESASAGTDTVYAAVDRTLGANIENLRMQGTAGLTGTGNDLANRLFGNSGANLMQGLAGADTLDGKDGADTLSGGAGNDTLAGGSQADVFRFAATNAGADRITDFNKNADRFQLSGGSFTNAQVSGADTILTHNGGTVRVEGIANLTLAQWNALVIPGGESGGGLPSPGGWLVTLALAARAQNDIVELGHGDYIFA